MATAFQPYVGDDDASTPFQGHRDQLNSWDARFTTPNMNDNNDNSNGEAGPSGQNGATNDNANLNGNDANGDGEAAAGDGDGGDGGNGGNPDDEAPEPISPEHIELGVKNSDEQVVHFKIKRSMAFKKLFEAYASREGKDVKSLRFLHDGQKILGTQRPSDLDMENGDTIDAVLEQIGGAQTENQE